MKLTINVKEHEDCPRGCFLSTGDRLLAESLGITSKEAHALVSLYMECLVKAIEMNKT